ncbi:MAG TPA: bifunctional (p)ppGpp synthetase/guanosine-3',5'-bis(diphosphate) 3'-pyrophosphohydrolase [Thermoanaerobaculia bacterium]|nr:bifunctional (p)ppGpp synthetase/guanosine-3',5'-bis(diphosphate) 3'-pyrophosphohydrolase [Thermoanaerobaculia bacterium]
MIRFEDILEKVEAYNPQFDEDLLRRAYVFSGREHRGQIRRSGEPYLVHPLNVAAILADMRADDVSIVVGLLHDVLEDTLTTKEAIAQQFGSEVADLVDGLTKIGRFSYVSREEEQAETFRKMILAMVSDLRVVLVKLADRLHNMRTLEFLPPERRREIARETMDIYAPIANRLGMGLFKGELEDLAFQHLEPEEYGRVAKEVERGLKGSEGMIEQVRARLQVRLAEAGIAGEVSGRQKRLYSIASKMRRRGVDVAQLHDLLAFRIVVPETRDCYASLGLVHQFWRPVPGRIKDYIAMPKPNFYQSLHTTVISEVGTTFEVQIRTREMDLIAERGIAAHWKYKEGRLGPQPDDTRFQWLRQLVDWQKEVSDPRQFLSALKVDLYPDEVYTFTPKGKVFAFPRGATSVDFAYRVHTDIGHHCVGAKVNGKLVPLRAALESGDIVEILTGPNQTPSRDWLSFVVTSRARHKIRQFIHTQEKLQAVELGRRLLDRELKKFKKSLKKVEQQGILAQELGHWGFSRPEDLYAAVGYGKIPPRAALERFVAPEELAQQTERVSRESAVSRVVRKILPFGTPDIVVVGHNDLMATLAKCCSPVPGESIVGYITRGRGVSVHSQTCPNVGNLLYDPERQIDVAWAGQKKATYAIELDVIAQDRPGLLADLTKAIAGEGSNIRRIEARADEARKGYVSVALETSDMKHLEKILSRIRAVAGVREVIRKYNVPRAGERS